MLPIEYCREVFFAYEMYDEALQMLFHKGEYAELMQTLRNEVEAAVTKTKQA